MATRFCTQCGQPIPENSKFCVNCGAPVPPMPPQDRPVPEPEPQPEPSYAKQTASPTTPKPQSFLVGAILATIFCCLPLGIPAIVFAAKVDNCWNAGDYLGAEAASRKAKGWMWAAIIAYLIVAVIYIAWVVLIYLGVLTVGSGLFEGLEDVLSNR